MVNRLTRHDVKWLAPAPMWGALGDLADDDARRCFNRPAILRFNHDDFMEELLSVLSYYPDRLSEWQVKPETWREPMATPATAEKLSLVEPLSQFSKRMSREQTERNATKPGALPASNASSSSCVIEQDPDKPLKLFQPAQQRFYLVVASLVCRRAGLPDRFIDSAKQELSGFVMRRLIPSDSTEIKTPDTCDPDKCDEYALVLTADGPQWRNISNHDYLQPELAVPDEERIPMFTLGFSDMEERKRKLISGFIPVGKREAYLAAPLFDEQAAAEKERAQESGDTQGLSDRKRAALRRLFDLQVAGPWKEMIDQAYTEKQKASQWGSEPPSINQYLDPSSPDSSDTSEANNLKTSREQIQTLSWYVLVDLVHYLEKYLNSVFRVVSGVDNRSDLASIEERNLYDALASVTLHPDLQTALDAVDYHSYSQIKMSLLQALQTLVNDSQIEVNLEEVDEPYDQSTNTYKGWPPFLFPLADPELVALTPLPDLNVDADTIDEGEPDISMARIDELSKLVELAIEESLEVEAPEVVTFKEPELDNGDGWFVIRCIHEQPNCGPFYPAVLSQPTEPFKMASFFDPDAPGRPIRIPMPLDISPAGLRKFNKNTTLMISDMLCGKIKNIRKITFGDLVLSVLPWPFHKDLPKPSKTGPCRKGGNSFGMFCSLSIPIVTLAALILLIIIVALFNTFFYWLPLLFTCFPIPGLSGKKS